MAERRLSLLRDLERALLEAISESAEVHRSLERMRDEGYTLQIFLDCQRPGPQAAERTPDPSLEPARVPATASARSVARGAGARSAEREAGGHRARAARKAPPAAPAPLFRINSDDLAMLRALGIDPTRKGRARR